MKLPANKKIYFASDVHLGLYPEDKSKEREKAFVKWLETVRKDAAAIYLLGDIFDFWWEYKKVVPRGFVRFFGKITEITDAGIPVHFFTGNHDMWARNYFTQECGMIVHDGILICEFNEKKFYMAHGDGFGPGDNGYKLLKIAFRSQSLRWLYSRVHPNLAISIGHIWAKKSRYSNGLVEKFEGEENERLIPYSKNILKQEHFDYFVFGHRHLALDYKLNEKSNLMVLGDWITLFTYGVFDGEKMELKKWDI